MPLPKFAYLTPKSLKEAAALLAEHGDKARLMAGGTDLLIRMRHRAAAPEFLIGLSGLKGLDYVTFDREKGLAIGALAKLVQVAQNPDVQRNFPALAHSAAVTATVQIRNMGTLVGNICNAAPSADNATPLLAYGALVVIANPGGERTLPIEEFFRGPGQTALELGELVKEIRLPAPGGRSGSDYQKISARSKVDIAAVGVSASIDLDDAGSAARVRIALGAVGPVPLRAGQAEKILQGRKPNADLIAQAGQAAAGECRPITDVRATAAYRRRMVDVLTVRAIEKSLDIASQRLAGCEL
jgi:carbon-monoxide dehydrogenase medium subunit